MRPIVEIMADKRVRLEQIRLEKSPGVVYYHGRMRMPKFNTVVFSIDGGRWEHASMALDNRCPTWDEMCLVKDIFWSEDETVVQFHPKKTAYVNLHPYCLHLWKKIGEEHELPDN